MPATYDDATVMLQLATLYQNMDLTGTSSWIFSDDFPTEYAAFVAANPPGSDRFNEFMRYASYYETLGTLWKHDLFDEDLLFDWALIPWNRVSAILKGYREEREVPRLFENFEAMGSGQERWERAHV